MTTEPAAAPALMTAAVVERVTELPPTHPLFPAVQKLVEDRQAEA
ncbi:hypothetical protein [Paenarthrobacter nicotinovorans]|nr:hypothetical protein [Paenarthrobacter nicotinovorans]MDI2020977.1 hypothetical protein [Paenarthrobacter nicotinovorans]